MDVGRVGELYADAVFKVRDLGITLSDRRAVKVLKLVAASALLCGRETVQPSDLWVLRYVWDREEQIGPLAALVNGLLEPHAGEPRSHPLAAPPSKIDGEALARELEELEREVGAAGASPRLAVLARLRERATALSDRAAWVTDEARRKHLLARAGALVEKLG